MEEYTIGRVEHIILEKLHENENVEAMENSNQKERRTLMERMFRNNFRVTYVLPSVLILTSDNKIYEYR